MPLPADRPIDDGDLAFFDHDGNGYISEGKQIVVFKPSGEHKLNIVQARTVRA